ncbi:MAG: YidB family protein [Beijerinckiaceae bacterium]|nr:YidB family protein [Beijerinckiaceae bacterium]
MARATPSLTALLGLLAVAGYQNRDKISEMLRGSTAGGQSSGSGSVGEPGASPNLAGLLTGAAGAGGIGGLLATGLKDLVDRFGASGDREAAESWVRNDTNKECSADALRRALGSETLADLQAHTGLSESELVERLCQNLPEAVDKYTPDGRIA